MLRWANFSGLNELGPARCSTGRADSTLPPDKALYAGTFLWGLIDDVRIYTRVIAPQKLAIGHTPERADLCFLRWFFSVVPCLFVPTFTVVSGGPLNTCLTSCGNCVQELNGPLRQGILTGLTAGTSLTCSSFPEVFIFSTFVLTLLQMRGLIVFHIQELRLSVSNVSLVGV